MNEAEKTALALVEHASYFYREFHAIRE